jgi:hypothetical protein
MKHAYQETVPGTVPKAAWARGHLTPLEFLRIAAWKSARGLGWLSLNAEGDIEQRTEAAMTHLKPWHEKRAVEISDDETWAAWRETSRRAIGSKTAKTGLLGLHGVDYPMATAVLCVLDPDVWPVMDRWAVLTVFGTSFSTRAWQRGIAYEAYTRRLATAGREAWGMDLNIHALDLAAMDASRKGVLPSGWTTIPLPEA